MGGVGGRGLAGAVALAVASGSIGAALLLASGGVGYATLTLYELFPQAEEAPGASAGPVSVVSSALNAVVSGLGNAAVFASGCWALLGGWAGRRTRRLSPSLSVLLLVWGVAGVLTFVVPALVSLTLVLGLVALVWLGAVLLRPPGHGPRGPGTRRRGLATTRKRTVPGGSGSRARRIPRRAAARLRVRTTTRGRSPGSRGSVTTCPRSRRRRKAR